MVQSEMMLETSKINIMVEKYCDSWNGSMKEAMKNVFRSIVTQKSDIPACDDAERYQADTVAQGVIAFMEDAAFLSANQSSKLSDFAADLYYG